MKRIVSLVLCFVLLANMVIFADMGFSTDAHAVTTNQQNIVARADYMYNSTWVCQKTIYGWNYRYTFYAGQTYHLPYAWPVHAGAYIGFGISTEDFLAAAADPNNAFYKYRSYVSGVSYSYSTYYGSDCSSFVSWCWGIKRNTTYTIPNYSTYIGSVSTYNSTWKLQLGDALNSQDHVVLVTDLQYDSNGAIKQIEITEQTPPQMKRTYHTPASLSAKYGGSYSIYRYYGNVPAAPYSKPVLPGSPVSIGDSFTATISNVNANMNVAVNDEGNVVIMDKAVDTAQQWKFTRRSDGSYEIKNVKTGKCLDVAASSADPGANVHVWDDLDNAAQSWFVYYIDGHYALRPGCATDCVLDVAGSGTTSGTNVATWTYLGGDAQMFDIAHVVPTEIVNLGDSFTAKITNVGSGKNLSIYEPNNVVLYHDTTNPAQQWKFSRQADGSYKITNVKYGTCMDVNNGSSDPGTNVQIWEDNGNLAQRWFICKAGDYYVLRPAFSFDTVLDVSGGFSDDNTNIQTWSYNSGLAQMFTIKKLSTLNGYEAGYAGGIAGDGKIYAHGLDLSAWQGTGVDFNAIKNAGYSYVILRAGTTKGKDTCFETLYTNAKAAGLNVGAYYYSYATTVEQSAQDAQNMLDWVQGKLFEYPLYFDYEDASQNNLSAETSKNICLTFMDRLANAGYLTGMYTGYYKSTLLPMSTICAKYESWIANYYDYTYQTLSPSYSTRYGMYQYTDRNYVNGAGPYDANVAFKDYPAIVKQYGFNGYASEVVEEVPVLDTTPVDLGSDFYAKITNVGAGKNLSIYEPNNVVIYQSSTNPAQEWHFVRQDDGSYEITNVKYNKVLDVEWGNGVAGDNVDIWDDLNNSGQRWFIYSSGASYVLRPACSEDCVLDVAGSATANDSNVILWTYNGCNAQRFTINQILPREVVDLGESFTAKITNAASGKNLSIYEPNNVVIYQNSTNPAQQWKFVRQADGSYEITNVKYGKCMDVDGSSNIAGANVQIWDDLDNTAQRWFIYSVNGHYVIRPACADDTVLDVYCGLDVDDTNVQTWTYTALEPQLFDIRKISPEDYANIGESFTAFITNVNADKNLTATGTAAGVNVDIQTPSPDAAQKWEFVRQADGSYEIKNAASGLCLDVQGGLGNAGDNIEVWDDINNSAQRWFVYALESGQYILYPACATDAVLDIAGSGTEDGSNVELWTYNGSGAQLFWITKTIPVTPEDLGEDFIAKIINVSSGKNVSVEDGSNVVQYEDTAKLNQQWHFVRQADGSYEITNLQYGLCMDVAGSQAENDGNIQLYEDLDNSAQRWFIYKVNGHYVFRPACSDACVMDLDFALDTNYANIQTWNFHGGDAQLFELKKIDHDKPANLGKSFVVQITNVNADKNLSIYEPNNVILYQKSDSKAQWWRFDQQPDGSYEITNVKYNKVLDVEWGLGNAGDNICIWDDLNNSGQRWYVYEALDGEYVLRPACSQDCVLDVSGSGTENETNIQIWTYNACDAQMFTFTDVNCAHNWVAADCDSPKTCSICGVSEGEALGHKWQNATCTAPKTCTVCGETEGEVVHDYNSYHVCKKCYTLRPGEIAGIYGFNISLGGNIAVKYYMVLDDTVVADENAKILFEVPESGSTYTKEVLVSEAQRVGDFYVFNCEVAAKEITSQISAKIVSNSSESDVFTYSLKTYSEVILSKPDVYAAEIELVKSMLNYSAAAQIYFNHNTDDLANESLYMSDDDKVLADVDLSDFAYALSGEQAGVSFYGAGLSLESETAIKLFFTIDGDAEEIEFSVNGEIVTAVKNGSFYEIKISDIAAHQLGDMYEVKAGGLTLNYGVFSYGNKAMGTSNETLKNTVKALYAYYQAAVAYKEQ